jgi:hypothetical protein
VLELLFDRIQPNGAAAEAPGQLLSPVGRAVGDDDALRAAGNQVDRCEIAHLPGSDHQDLPPTEVSKHPTRKLGRGRGDRGRVLADRRLRPNPSADTERLAEEPVQSASDRFHRAGGLVSTSYLPEDLCLAGDERVEACGDPEEVDGRRLVAKRVERRLDLGSRHACPVRQLLERASFRPVGMPVDQVELGAVAGREGDGLAASVGQASRELTSLGVSQVQPFAELDRRPLVRGPDKEQRHLYAAFRRRASSVSSATSRSRRESLNA